MANGVKFIRVHGRVVPVRDKGSASAKPKQKAQKKKSGTDLTLHFQNKKTTAASRAKEGGKAFGIAGGLLGGLSGSQFGVKGLFGGAALGAAGLGAAGAIASAVFGARTETNITFKSMKHYGKKKKK